MAGSESGRRRTAAAPRAPASLLCLALALGCAARAPREPELPTPLPAAPPPAGAPAEPATAPPAADPAPARPSTVIVVEEGGAAADEGGGLVAAARAERARREAAGPPAVVLTDRNLKEFGRDQKLTEAAPKEREKGADSAARTPDVAAEERYWRDRGRGLRTQWRAAAADLAADRNRAAELRVLFYATDDPFLRDGEIKPAWDRAIERIGEREREIEEIRRELDLFLEEGQRAGALPAWLDDGVDLEPGPDVPVDPVSEPGEPTVVEEPPG
ncbi:MAG: hypothetical protein KJ058_00215 [Thermoanaerobaculia bacterium]|nr:hypothetical protein [Thermoanaerobaculia bacterium]